MTPPSTCMKTLLDTEERSLEENLCFLFEFKGGVELGPEEMP